MKALCAHIFVSLRKELNKNHKFLNRQFVNFTTLLYFTCAETQDVKKNEAAANMSMPGSPFVEVIQSLAGLHQEQHQALLGLRDDQERCFPVIVQAQQEDRELFRNWMDREVRAAGPPSTPAQSLHMPLQKMGP